MRVEAVSEWRLAPACEAAVAALLARAFPVDFAGRSFFKQRHHLRLLAWDDAGGEARLLGHVGVTWRAVRLGGRLLDVAGLAEVATDPGRRGEGIASALVAAAIAEAEQSLAAHLLLFGDAGLYAAQGFRPAGNPVRHLEMDGGRSLGVRGLEESGLMVRPLGPAAWDGAVQLDLLGPMF